MSISGFVTVDHHQFTFGSSDAETLAECASGSLLTVGRDFVTLRCGIAYGPVSVELDRADSLHADANFSDWDVVEEATVPFSSKPVVMTLHGEIVLHVPSNQWQGAGTYRVRAHARGRDINWDRDVTEPTENYLLIFTPAESSIMGLQRLKKIDRAWDEPIVSPPANPESVLPPHVKNDSVDTHWQHVHPQASRSDLHGCADDARIAVAGPALGLDANVPSGTQSSDTSDDSAKRPRIRILRGGKIDELEPYFPGIRHVAKRHQQDSEQD